jgi:glycosyltransferase involved in cell wall biosynthesis
MGRLHVLEQTLGPMVDQPGVSCVVVDYSCPDGAGDWVETHYPSARVIRVPGETRFNASAARNAGARQADADWIAFVDSDVVLDPGFVAAILPILAPGGFYRTFSADRGLGGTFVCARADFERVGGYDEVYPCWGEEDNDLFDALQFAGVEPRELPKRLLRHLAHGDDERTRFYHVTDRVLGHAINRVYRIVKWDAARVRRELLPLDMRRALYVRIDKMVTAAFETGEPGDLAVHFPVGLVPGGWSLPRQLTYRLTKDT